MYTFYPKIFVHPPSGGRAAKILLVMKLTTLLLIVGILQVSAATFAQKVTLKENNASLKEVFSQIRNQTGYDFVVTSDLLTLAKPITIDVKNEELNSVLDEIFSDQPLEFTLQEKTVVVSKKEPTVLDKAKAYLAQATVYGKVTNELGEPMAGATVKEKGNDNTTVTDAKGNYSITVANDNSIITFSYVGYETQELGVKNIPVGSVVILKAAPQNLQEVVIKKGYYDEKRGLSTGDVGFVSAKTIEEQPVSDPIQALIGRVSGLNIQQTSGVPGSYAAINIRGINSLANGNDPFYVVDGVPFSSTSNSVPFFSAGALGYATSNASQNSSNSNGATPGGGGLSPFNVINPDDIESIEVLKDADATSIYGSRGANGVILITTKKGKAGETKVAMDVSQGIGQVGHFMDLLNTQQYLQMYHQAYANDGLPYPSLKSNPNDNSFDLNGLWDTTRYTNWQKFMIGGTAHYTNAQASVSGGTTNTQFLVGAGYNRQTTVYPGDYGDEKGSVHFSLNNSSSNQKFHLQLTGSYGYENNVVPQTDFAGSVTTAPDAPALYNPDGSLNWEIYNGNATFGNPLSGTLITYSSVVNSLTSNIDLSYEIVPGLIIKSDFGYSHNETNVLQLTPATTNPPPYDTDPINRSNFNGNTLNNNWIIEPQVSYRRKIGKGDLNFLLGATMQQQSSSAQGFDAYGFSSDALISDAQAATNFIPEGFISNIDRYEAALARVSYNWDGKYLLNLTGNRDGSSRFGPGKQFANFGSVGTGWIFSKEKAVEQALPWLSFGKLRLSYGTTGNYQIGFYQYLTTYGTSGNSYQGVNTLSPNNLPNQDYSWEVDKKLEGGLDLGFLKDKINLTISYYRNRSGNELVQTSLPETTGIGYITQNLPAVIQNTGLEVNLNTVNIKSKNFSWTTLVNFTDPKNKLIAYPGLATSANARFYTIGQSLLIQKLYQYTGVDPQTGLYTVKTANGNGLPSSKDLVPTQPVTQKYYGGIGNDFTYKNFSLDIFIQVVDQLGYNYQKFFNAPGSSDQNNQPTAILGAWTTPGQTATVQRYSSSGAGYYSAANIAYQNFIRSNGILTNTSFVKIKNAALSYRLPGNWERWARMQNAKVFIQGQNLYTFTKYIGFDPETPGLGLPPLRVITAGLSATF